MVIKRSGPLRATHIKKKQYCSPKQDSNLGPKRLSLLEFETWQIKPLSHHG